MKLFILYNYLSEISLDFFFWGGKPLSSHLPRGKKYHVKVYINGQCRNVILCLSLHWQNNTGTRGKYDLFGK